MKRALTIKTEMVEIDTVQGLTSVFESIASLRIAQIKNKVVTSKAFFAELWQIYTQLRADSGSSKKRSAKSNRDAFIVVTSDGGLSGDIDYKIIERMIKDYNPETTDVVVIGGHGATQLASRGTPIAHYFKLPDVFDKSVDLGPIVALLNQYHQVSVFYETYVSLAIQGVERIDLQAAVKTQGEDQATDSKTETISSRDYVFEPSLGEVVEYMESTMIEVVLSQVILESRLAQFASRFNAMSTANDKAKDIRDELNLEYYRAKRGESDERLKEIVNGMKALA